MECVLAKSATANGLSTPGTFAAPVLASPTEFVSIVLANGFRWGADDGNVTGARRFHAFVGVVMVVQVLFALLLARAPRWEGTLGQTRLGPIAEALRQPPAA